MNRNKLFTSLLACILSSVSLMADVSNIVYDYIIVGNGTAGAVLARKLSDNKKHKVLVIEAGINNNNDPAVLNSNFPNLFNDLTAVTFNPKYASTFSIPVFNPLTALVYSEGRGWGGSSAHNYFQVIRGTPSTYDAWADLSGNEMWAYNNMLSSMLALENYTPAGTTINFLQRGRGGPINVTQTNSTFTDPLTMALYMATQAGYVNDCNDPTSPNLVPGTPANVGFSSFQLFADPGPTVGSHGNRSFSSNTFLLGAVDNEGRGLKKRLLRIESNAFVDRVIFSGKKAVGIEFIYANNPNEVKKAFGKQIILCAGAINSPAILQRSGIGSAALLESLGIEVLVDNPNVGANLQNQYGVIALAKFPTASTADPFVQGFSNASHSGLPHSNYPNDSVRRLQLDAADLGPVPPAAPDQLIQFFGFIMNPNSRGSLHIVSKNLLIEPFIDLNMYSAAQGQNDPLTEGTDANLTVTAYQLIANAMGPANMFYPAAANFALPTGGPREFALLAAAENLVGSSVASHICGTTRMAKTMETGVVDGNLNVFGVENLMVCDFGCAPLTPDGNTCYCVYVLALGAAKILGAPVPPGL